MFIAIEELPKVAVDEMNDVHQNEVNIVNKLYEDIVNYESGHSDLEKVKDSFAHFLNDVISHFTFENELMKEYNFFAYNMHRAEHDRVISELKYLEKILNEKGDVKAVKDYLICNFKPWLISHVQSMDTVTAMYISNII